MADEHRSYPPTERRLARLWSAGATPASGALVAVAVLASAWLLIVAAGPLAIAWCAELVRQGLAAAASPGSMPEAALSMVLRGAWFIAIAAAVMFGVAVAAQILQRGAAPAGSPSQLPAEQGSSLQHGFSGRGLVRAMLMIPLALVVVVAVARGSVIAGPALLLAEEPGRAAAGLLTALGWPLLLALAGAALLDVALSRAAWRRGAWMTRREREEESREVDGHPLTGQRRHARMRGR